MTIDEILCLKFPKESESGHITTLFNENGEMYIEHFDVSGVQLPDKETLAIWELEARRIKAAAPNNAAIYDELDEIDRKSIRALRVNDTRRLEELESKAATLRSKLIKV